MRLYIIRHAQSANNALYAATGSDRGRLPDPPLTGLGHQQARLLAGFLAERKDELSTGYFAARHDHDGFQLTNLYTSLMVRAVATASYIAESTGLPLRAWPEVHERGGLHVISTETGQEEGVPGWSRAEFAREFPLLVLPDSLGESGWWNRPPETPEAFLPRARAFWHQLLTLHGDTDDRVAVITHGGFFQSLMAALLAGENPNPAGRLGVEETWFGISNASVSRFEFSDGVFVIRYLNRVDFLPPDLITG